MDLMLLKKASLRNNRPRNFYNIISLEGQFQKDIKKYFFLKRKTVQVGAHEGDRIISL